MIMTSLKLDVQYGTTRANVPAVGSMRRWAELALSDMMEPLELSVRIVGEEEGTSLNKKWRNRSYATNVLSFKATAPPGVTPRPLGDIVLCAPVVLCEAKQQCKPVMAHWAHLLLHGTLHLLGYDHERQRDAEVMERQERQFLKTLGFADPYMVRK